MSNANRRVLVIHGPNLNMLGKREPDVYGSVTLDEINASLSEKASSMGSAIDIFQSNHEGEIVDKIQSALSSYVGLIINPGAYTHTSVAIHDALRLLSIPVIEVHLSNIHNREAFRHKSLVSPVATGIIAGLGATGYRLALEAILE
jgi:3-dehydroquinate dehydratase-2